MRIAGPSPVIAPAVPPRSTPAYDGPVMTAAPETPPAPVRRESALARAVHSFEAKLHDLWARITGMFHHKKKPCPPSPAPAPAPAPAPKPEPAPTPAPQPCPAPAPQPPQHTYQVRSGDSLWSIAARELGGGQHWKDIYNANKGVVGFNPNCLQPGQILRMP